MNLNRWIPLVLVLLLAACGQEAPPTPVVSPVEMDRSDSRVDVAARVAALDALYEQFFEDSLALNPLRATFMGDHRWSDRWPNTLGEAHRQASLTLHQDYLERLLAAGSDTDGMHGLSNGEAWYARLVANTTTTDLSPAEIHQIGLDEVERIDAQIRAVMAEVGFEGDLDDFFEFTRTDPRFVFDTPEDLIAAHEAMRERVDAIVPEYFTLLPEADYEIRAVEPFRERSAAGGSYMRPAADGSRPGIFHANTYNLSARPSWSVASLFLHEAAPGHHFQIALQQETEALPRFRRFGSYTAYVEGWALYAEHLGHEMGIYGDPYARYGAYSAELWRAIRLVVDTGLHYHGWSREDVLDYMYANSAAAALGADFDIRQFHARVLQTGAVPLDGLAAHVRDWVAASGG
ncbi:MAG: DUF885 domain-containing protein [Wenzhouxiangella sp.]|nr:MAG: DUF885 domain-containing protein [Wenzhouxiangella sp.]